MKQITSLGWLGMSMLATTAAFTACSSDDGITEGTQPEATAPVNPTYDGQSVKTTFAINIPYAGSSKRMTGENTQQNGNFTGMSDLRLMPLNTESLDGSTATSQIITLGDIASGITSDNSRQLYSDVNIPVGTKRFVFYAQSKGSKDAADATGYNAHGALNQNLSGATFGDYSFSLKQIYNGSDWSIPYTEPLAQVLTNVAQAAGWKDYTGTNESLKKLYKQFTENMHAGSAEAVRLALQDLYNAVYPTSQNSTASTEKDIATAIISAINPSENSLFNRTGSATYWTLAYDNAELAQFPTNLNLPEGAAMVEFKNAENKFEYIETAGIGAPGSAVVVKKESLCFPSALMYYTYTELRANDKEITDAEWPNSTTDWKNYLWPGWNNEVKASTRSIALKDNINYGVALLETKLCSEASQLQDNAQAIAGAAANASITVGENFQITGVLVGGQPTSLGYDLLPNTSTTYTNTIYDNCTSQTIKTNGTTYTTPNYTLVLDTKGESTKKVNIAIEIQNNTGAAFYGKDGKIENRQRFYLVGQLDVATAGSAPTGITEEANKRVFIQDYKTVAQFKVKSLQNAYQTIPDLRSSNLKLGLSVDLEWQAGYSFEVSID